MNFKIEKPRYALTLNTLGTKRVVQLAKKLLNLKVSLLLFVNNNIIN